jgi:hypothetical protein
MELVINVSKKNIEVGFKSTHYNMITEALNERNIQASRISYCSVLLKDFGIVALPSIVTMKLIDCFWGREIEPFNFKLNLHDVFWRENPDNPEDKEQGRTTG